MSTATWPAGPLRTTAWTVTRADIAAYAAASGDHNPIHLDDDAARRLGFDGVIAHGVLTMARAAAAVADALPDVEIGRLRVRFAQPVRPGDTVTFRLTMTADDDGVATVAITASNQRGEPVLNRATAEVRRRA